MNYEKIIQKISPTEEEKNFVKTKTKEIVQKIQESAKKKNYSIVISPGGSTAKDTFLKGDYDIDIFVRFKFSKEQQEQVNLKKHAQELSDMLEELLRDAKLSAQRIHGSRDYFQFTKENLHFEIVPVKYIKSKEEVENITDMSPLHVEWVKKHIKNLSSDIRLAKQFCKANGVYGAESYINGISGHVLDILIIHYGSFDNFIQAVARWNRPVVIDPEKKHQDVFKELNEAKLQSPLIVIDPVDENRNASAALSQEKFDLLIQQTKKFLEEPNESFFTIIPFDIENIKREHKKNQKDKSKDELTNLFIIELQPLEGAKDVVGTKVLKVFEYLERELKEHDFKIKTKGWHFNQEKSHLYFEIPSKELDKTYIRKGPPVKSKEGSKKFKEKHGEKVFEKNSFLYAEIKRKYLSAESLLKELIKGTYLQSRAKHLSMHKF